MTENDKGVTKTQLEQIGKFSGFVSSYQTAELLNALENQLLTMDEEIRRQCPDNEFRDGYLTGLQTAINVIQTARTFYETHRDSFPVEYKTIWEESNQRNI